MCGWGGGSRASALIALDRNTCAYASALHWRTVQSQFAADALQDSHRVSFCSMCCISGKGFELSEKLMARPVAALAIIAANVVQVNGALMTGHACNVICLF